MAPGPLPRPRRAPVLGLALVLVTGILIMHGLAAPGAAHLPPRAETATVDTGAARAAHHSDGPHRPEDPAPAGHAVMAGLCAFALLASGSPAPRRGRPVTMDLLAPPPGWGRAAVGPEPPVPRFAA